MFVNSTNDVANHHSNHQHDCHIISDDLTHNHCHVITDVYPYLVRDNVWDHIAYIDCDDYSVVRCDLLVTEFIRWAVGDVVSTFYMFYVKVSERQVERNQSRMQFTMGGRHSPHQDLGARGAFQNTCIAQ